MEYHRFSCLCSPLVLRLIFKSFIHLEFIFVYGVVWWLSFISLHVAVQLSQHHLKSYFYSSLCFCPLCQILIDHRDMVYVWAVYSVPLIYVSSYSSSRLFWLQWPCNIVQCQVLCPSYFILLTQNCCGYSGLFMIPYKFLKYFPVSVKYVIGILMGIALDL